MQYELTKRELDIIQYGSSNKNYNAPLILNLGSDIDIYKLKQSIYHFFTTHPYMFTIYKKDGDTYKKEIKKDKIKIKFLKLDSIDLDKLITKFELLDNYLFSLKIINIKEDYYLYIDIHQLLLDPHSIKLLLKDINDIYLEEYDDKEETDFLNYQTKIKLLDINYKPTNLDFDLDSENQTFNLCRDDIDITEQDLIPRNIKDYRAFFASVLIFMLSRLNKQTDIAISLLLDKREQENQNSIGNYIKDIIINTNLDDNDTINSFISKTKAEIKNEYEVNEKLPISFIYQEEPDYDLYNAKYLQKSDDRNLSFKIYKQDDTFSIKISYLSSSYKKETILQLIKIYKSIINEFLYCKTLKDISLIDEDEYSLLEQNTSNDEEAIYILDEDLNVLPRLAKGIVYFANVNKDKQSDATSSIDNHFNTKKQFPKLYTKGLIGRFNMDFKLEYQNIKKEPDKKIFSDEVLDIDIQLTSEQKNLFYNKNTSFNKLLFKLIDDADILDIQLSLNRLIKKHRYLNKMISLDDNNDLIFKNTNLNVQFISTYRLNENNLGMKKIKINSNLATIKIIQTKKYKYLYLETSSIIDKDLFDLLVDDIKLLMEKYIDIEEDINSYDILKNNTYDMINDLDTSYKMDTILLTGATSFLGIHLLAKLLDQNKKIICVLMKGKVDNKVRLETLLKLYYNNTYVDKFNDLVSILELDILDENNFDTILNLNYDMIINATNATSDNETKLQKLNINLVNILADIACKKSIRLIHLSTSEIRGFKENYIFKENDLEFDQYLDTNYLESKLEAEKIILKKIEQGLDAKIIRIDNLVDSFDKDINTVNEHNLFSKLIKEIINNKYVPNNTLDLDIYLSPIDTILESVIKLATINQNYNVLNLYNNKSIKLGQIIKLFDDIHILTDEEFKNIEANKKESIYHLTRMNNDYTIKLLSLLNVYFDSPSNEYIKKYIFTLTNTKSSN